jgi:hypothetical protein
MTNDGFLWWKFCDSRWKVLSAAGCSEQLYCGKKKLRGFKAFSLVLTTTLACLRIYTALYCARIGCCSTQGNAAKIAAVAAGIVAVIAL